MIRVFAASRRFTRFVAPVRTAARKLLTATGHRNGVVDIFIVGTDWMDTNVVSFPAPELFPRPDLPGQFLGEIYLNPLYIKAHGEDLHFMLIHGFLHLLGYDHVRRSDRMTMERKERALMRAVRP